jgi:hypothetical protein
MMLIILLRLGACPYCKRRPRIRRQNGTLAGVPVVVNDDAEHGLDIAPLAPLAEGKIRSHQGRAEPHIRVRRQACCGGSHARHIAGAKLTYTEWRPAVGALALRLGRCDYEDARQPGGGAVIDAEHVF